ncbi:MAG: hypothetical protein C4324_09140 [Blastocatellia bacterium]
MGYFGRFLAEIQLWRIEIDGFDAKKTRSDALTMKEIFNFCNKGCAGQTSRNLKFKSRRGRTLHLFRELHSP